MSAIARVNVDALSRFNLQVVPLFALSIRRFGSSPGCDVTQTGGQAEGTLAFVIILGALPPSNPANGATYIALPDRFVYGAPGSTNE